MHADMGVPQELEQLSYILNEYTVARGTSDTNGTMGSSV